MRNDEEMKDLSWNENDEFIPTNSLINDSWHYQAGEAAWY